MSIFGISPSDIVSVGVLSKQAYDAFDTNDGSKSQYLELRHGLDARIQTLQDLASTTEASTTATNRETLLKAVRKSIEHDQKQQARLEKYENSLGVDSPQGLRQGLRALQFAFSGAKQHREREEQVLPSSIAAIIGAIQLASENLHRDNNSILSVSSATKQDIAQHSVSLARDISKSIDTIGSRLTDSNNLTLQRYTGEMCQNDERLTTKLESEIHYDGNRTRVALEAAAGTISGSIESLQRSMESRSRQQEELITQQQRQIQELIRQIQSLQVKADRSTSIPPVVGNLSSLRSLCAFNSWCAFNPKTCTTALERSQRHHAIPGWIYIASTTDHEGLKIGYTIRSVRRRLNEWMKDSGIHYTSVLQVQVEAPKAAEMMIILELHELGVNRLRESYRSAYIGRTSPEIFDIQQATAIKLVCHICELIKSMDAKHALAYVTRLLSGLQKANKQNPWR